MKILRLQAEVPRRPQTFLDVPGCRRGGVSDTQPWAPIVSNDGRFRLAGPSSDIFSTGSAWSVLVALCVGWRPRPSVYPFLLKAEIPDGADGAGAEDGDPGPG